MTPERAQEIVKQARDKATCGPWSDQLDKVMTKEERNEVNQVWDKMPGHTCFVDALYSIARARAGKSYMVNTGGLFRCCIDTITHDIQARKAGDTLTCPHCKDEVVLGSDEVWRWAQRVTIP